ncbi:hypothetical protein AncyloWKF20_07410 [Ancylobacter sp. WKF20]|uniref:hypothetical protein n=1 Tax=Ancylobacter sp. WKF20 TaxID=3039801 RepID=UPI0024344C22|nr:hypothetical protein [Ancylobacter sp. WKF20]WGD31637.1 hypothetical protein AncyloWKF20_07410 [Ancylobacter sp. WKF20]
MANVYDQHDKAFAGVSAYIILGGDDRKVATVAFKHPKDGAARLYAYVHWLGTQMVRGHANGFGYDKRTAAASVAAGKLPSVYPVDRALGELSGYDAFRAALLHDAGPSWQAQLERAGFRVWQAV